MYPVCLNIRNQLCIVVGGGAVAERKVLSLLEAGARVRIVSPRLTDTLRELAATGRIEWVARSYRQGDLAHALLIFAATDKREVQELVVRDAQQAGQQINAADAPDQCSFHVPATVRQGDLTLAVSTNGTSPALAAKIRKQLEEAYGTEYGVLLRLMARIREQMLADGLKKYEDRKILFQNMLHDDILLWIRDGQRERLRRHLATVLGPVANCDFLDLIGSDR